MKTSELIAALQKSLEENGDKYVYSSQWHYDSGECECSEIDEVFLDKDGDVVLA